MPDNQLVDQNASLIAQANMLISQLKDVGCPERILNQLVEWNFDRTVALKKLNNWKAWANK